MLIENFVADAHSINKLIQFLQNDKNVNVADTMQKMHKRWDLWQCARHCCWKLWTWSWKLYSLTLVACEIFPTARCLVSQTHYIKWRLLREENYVSYCAIVMSMTPLWTLICTPNMTWMRKEFFYIHTPQSSWFFMRKMNILNKYLQKSIITKEEWMRCRWERFIFNFI